VNAANGFDLSNAQMTRMALLDTGFMSCTMASPCHDLAWELVADSIPHPDAWGGNRGGKGKSKGKRDSGSKGGEHDFGSGRGVWEAQGWSF